MTLQEARRLEMLSKQLAENLMSAALCAREIGTIAQGQAGGDAFPNLGLHAPSMAMGRTATHSRPLLDEGSLSVIWKGKTLHLGYTVAFRLLARLARRPNQYVTHLDLLRDVWDNEDLATATIRSVVRHLRQRLRGCGMHELASAIRGHNGRYILEL